MRTRRTLLLASAFALAAGAAPFALAQSQPATGQAPAQHMRHFDPARHLEGRIAYLRAELKITPEQQPLFDKLAAVLRENAQAMKANFDARRDQAAKPVAAVDRLEQRLTMQKARIGQSERYLEAFRPLYASFSAEQKQAADEMLSRRDHPMHMHRHRGGIH